MSDGKGLAPQAAPDPAAFARGRAAPRAEEGRAGPGGQPRAVEIGDLDALLRPDHGEGHRAHGGRPVDAVPGDRGRPSAVVEGLAGRRAWSRSGSTSARASPAGSRRRARSSTSPTRTPISGSSRRSISRAAIARGRSSACRCSARSAGSSACCRCSTSTDGPFTRADEELLLAARRAGRDRDRERAALSLAGHAEPGAARSRAATSSAGSASSTRSTRSRRSCPRRSTSTICCRASSRRRSPCSAGRGLDRARRARRRAAVPHGAGARRRRG